jgi:hypothetical protein
MTQFTNKFEIEAFAWKLISSILMILLIIFLATTINQCSRGPKIERVELIDTMYIKDTTYIHDTVKIYIKQHEKVDNPVDAPDVTDYGGTCSI